MESNAKAIQAVVESWVRAIQQKDMKGIVLHHTDDVLMFDVPTPIQAKGLSEYKKTWDLFFQYSPGGKDSFQLKELQIHAGDTVAFCTALIKLSSQARPQCRLTIGLKKINDQWMIAHEHHSSPQEMD